MAFLRIAAAARPAVRTSATRTIAPRIIAARMGVRNYSDAHEESFEEFTARYEKEFDNVQDVFELQRNLNNAFAYDLGVKAKVENKQQYQQYLDELAPVRQELGVELVEDLYPELSK
ncbi:cytochrome c oxidase, subunit VA/VI [Trichophaea hybrida]|nr:cytochrome c oxidase, subunit VA/VI [Trichophaea hybrida]